MPSKSKIDNNPKSISRHLHYLDKLILKEFDGDDKNWQSLLRRLPGYYPLDVLNSVLRLRLDHNKIEGSAPSLVRNLYPEAFPGLVEHPLDFEWRFTQESIQYIINRLKNALPALRRNSVAGLGCPSLIVAGAQVQSSWSWTLIDKRADLLSPILCPKQLIGCDLTREQPNISAVDAAVLDPPWYTVVTKHFLAQAQRFVRKNGLILLSFPPSGTRINAGRELTDLLHWCSKRNLRLESIESHCLFYKTPFFESNSLIAAGFKARIPAWRRAELIVLRNMSDLTPVTPYKGRVPRRVNDIWKEHFVNGIKICVKHDLLHNGRAKHDTHSPWLAPVWTEEILPTVSTRFPGRSEANVVTSGNRFFRSRSPLVVSNILEKLSQSGIESVRPQKNHFTEEQIDTITNIINKEFIDRDSYIKYLYD